MSTSPESSSEIRGETTAGDHTLTRTPPDAPPGEVEEAPVRAVRSEDELRALLGLRPSGEPLPAGVRTWGWIVTAAAGVLAALLRLVGLGHPHLLMFDETYYVKDAYALSRLGYEAVWADGANTLFVRGDFSAMGTQAAYVVHPQLGKWLIAGGMWLFGPESSVGWRFAPALFGVLTVVLLVRLVLRLTRSPFLGGVAGLFLALDGVNLTESRIGLLDVFIGFFALASLYCLVRDREWSRARLARRLAGTASGHLAPRAGVRPWLLATGVCLGLTCSIKWSGLYLLAVVGILVVVWDTLALRRVGARAWFLEGTVARGVGDFLRLVPVAFLVYLAGWFSWFLRPGGYDRSWAADQRALDGTVPRPWLPDALNSLLEYHLSMYRFHVGLDSSHPYQSQPIGWLLQIRPTSFYWPTEEEMGTQAHACGSDRCIQAITSIGNIPMWWAAFLALFVVVLLATVGRDWRAWVPLAGYLGLYAPWFLYPHRTIFTFYTVAFVPFVVMVLVLALGWAGGFLRPALVELVRHGSRPSRLGEFLGFMAPTPLRGGPGTSDDGVARGGAAPAPPASPAQDVGEEYGQAQVTAVAPAVSASADGAACVAGDGEGGGPSTPSSTVEPPEALGRAGWRNLDAFLGVPRTGLHRAWLVVIGVLVVLVVVFAMLWWPIWTGQTVDYDWWHWHMWLGSWI